MTHPLAWSKRAACSGQVELFYSETSKIKTARAKAICSKCDVRSECLSYAVENELHGIWGGTTGNERRKMRRAARKAEKVKHESNL